MKDKEDWNWMYKKNQYRIWLNIYKNLRNWEKDGFQNPITYFTDGLNRWVALEIEKGFEAGKKSNKVLFPQKAFQDGFEKGKSQTLKEVKEMIDKVVTNWASKLGIFEEPEQVNVPDILGIFEEPEKVNVPDITDLIHELLTELGLDKEDLK